MVRGRVDDFGGLPLVEVPPRRRLVTQRLAVPLLQDEPSAGREQISHPVGGSRQVREVVHRQRRNHRLERTWLGEFFERDAAKERSLGSDRIDGDDLVPRCRQSVGEFAGPSATDLEDAGGWWREMALHE